MRSRRVFLSVGLAMVSAVGHAAAVHRPHVVVIVADDLGYADVGFQGCTDIPTPHIDAIAAAGVVCTNGYVSGPYCSPTRAGLLTGRYQQRFGHEFNAGGPGGGLPLDQVTLADRLARAGYATAAVGKWHLVCCPRSGPAAKLILPSRPSGVAGPAEARRPATDRGTFGRPRP